VDIIFYAFNFYPLERGGMEKYLRILISKLKNNHKITLILPNRHNISIENVKIYHLYELFPKRKNQNIIYYILNSIFYLLPIFILIPRILKREKAKILSVFNFGIDLLFIQIIAKLFGKNVNMNIRGISSLDKRRDFIPRDLSLFFTDFLTINSKDLMERYKKLSFLSSSFINSKKTFYLSNGIDTTFWKKDNSNGNKKSYDLVFLGNVRENFQIIDKGFNILYKALKIIEKKYKKILKVLVIGDYSLENIKKNLGQFDKIFFDFTGLLKSKKKVKQHLLKANIFVLTSISEGMPNSLMEAMSLGMPCIASNVGAVSSLVENEKNGLIFNTRDSFFLAEQIWFLLNNKNLQIKLGNNARLKMISKFDWKISFQKIIRCYKQIEKS